MLHIVDYDLSCYNLILIRSDYEGTYLSKKAHR